MATKAEELSARSIGRGDVEKGRKIPELLVSADGHVDEPPDLWNELPGELRAQLPKITAWTPDKRPQGGLDPGLRIQHMDRDGVAAEILYPTAGLRAFKSPHKAQERAFRVYNDWLADYCKTSPKRLFGVPCLCVHDIDEAVAELRRCNDLGLLGGLVWQVPDPRLPFTSAHYEPLWAAAAEIGLPLNFHILSGHSYDPAQLKGIEIVRGSVNVKTNNAVTTLFDLIWTGVFDRHPRLKVELVEAEIGWLPFILQQWDYYYNRFRKPGDFQQDFPIERLPSEIFAEKVYLTFMDDFVGAQNLKFWGERNCMWSSDYPHANMTWPNSRGFIARQIGDLPIERQKRLVADNVIELYGLKL